MQQTINERLKILINTLQMSARAFSAQLEVPESNTRNYLDKQTKLNSDYLQRIAAHFKSVNLSWLITGEGAPLIDDTHKPALTQQASIKNNPGIGISNGGTNTVNNLNIEDCRRDLASANRELEHLRRELELQSALLASKEETITLLRASYNRPN